jgi:hypothetical protein
VVAAWATVRALVLRRTGVVTASLSLLN